MAEAGARDVTGEAGSETAAGDVTGNMSLEPGADKVTDDADTEPGTKGGASTEPVLLVPAPTITRITR